MYFFIWFEIVLQLWFTSEPEIVPFFYFFKTNVKLAFFLVHLSNFLFIFILFFLLLRRGLIKIISIIVKEKGKYTPYNIPCREADRLGAYIDEYHLPSKGHPRLFLKTVEFCFIPSYPRGSPFLCIENNINAWNCRSYCLYLTRSKACRTKLLIHPV